MRIYEESGITFLEMMLGNDFHVHLRELSQLQFLIWYSALQFGHILAMPNTKEPLTRVRAACLYNNKVRAEGKSLSRAFYSHVALYLTDDTTEDEIRLAHRMGILICKLYPNGATTNSSSGVTDVRKIWHLFALMEELRIPLSVHGEVTDPKVALWDCERVFVDTILIKIHEAFPKLKIILEHVSTWEGVQFVQSTPNNVGATVTVHHMLCNCNDVYLYPSRNCYPIINSPRDQRAVIAFAISGEKSCFLGTDSAPHVDSAKFRDGGFGGCFIPNAMELYAKAFESAGALDDRFEAFASFNGSNFYGLPHNTAKLRMVRKEHEISQSVQIDKGLYATPFMAGEILDWQVDSIIQ